MSMFDNVAAKLNELNEQHGDKIEGVSDNALDRAADVLNEKTGGKFGDQITAGRDLADGRIGTDEAEPTA